MYVEKYEKYRPNVSFIEEYKAASNAATGSKVDSNANVEHKNITTCAGELVKREKIGTNRLLMIDKLTEMFGADVAEEYIRQIETHEKYKHDETSIYPYCVSISMYPFITKGLACIGGISDAPTNLEAFSGSFINLVFAVAAQFAGAVATPEFFLYMDYFIRKDYGDDYISHLNDVVSPPFAKRMRTLKQTIEDKFQQITYSLNQPAAARDYQSVFWNVAYFDSNFFKGMFNDFVFPDGDEPNWETTSWLQKSFMEWLNAERLVKPLTFPVETLNLLDNGKDDYVDKEWADYAAYMYSKGHSFFTYRSDTVDSLSSCCRLKNMIVDNTFSFTLGAGGVATGSKGVITTNINRIVQNAVRDKKDIETVIREETRKNHKYLLAFNEIIKEHFNSKMLSIYDAGFIELSKQYLTQGINGFVEGAEFLGIEISPNDEYFKYGESILRPIYEENKAAKTDDIMFNTEFVPAENLGVKNAKWDKEDGYFVPRECYNSYFFVVEDETCNIIDKFILHGSKLTKYLDGGSALHCGLSEHLTKEQYRHILSIAIKTGCSYFTFNIPNTICNTCGHISKHRLLCCPKCGSYNIDYLTRIIGYLKRISSFSEVRQREANKRYYISKKEVSECLKN